MAVPAQIGADFSCSGGNSARSAKGRATTRAYVSYPSKIHPRKLAASIRQCAAVRSVYQGWDADRTETTEFISFFHSERPLGRRPARPQRLFFYLFTQKPVPTDRFRVRHTQGGFRQSLLSGCL